MAKRKRSYALSKHCKCFDQKKCSHDWWLRVMVNRTRQRVNLTELFPSDAPDVAAAKAKDLARRGQLQGGQLTSFTVNMRLTTAQAIAQYSGKKSYLNWLDPLSHICLADVTRANIENIADAVQSHGVKGSYSGKSARRHFLVAVQRLFRWALEHAIVTSNPTVGLKLPPSRSRKRRLRPGEKDRILAAADPFTLDRVTAMIESGARGGELLKLQWKDVFDDHIVLTTHKTKSGLPEPRDVPVSPTLKMILQRRRKGPDGTELSDDSFVFGDATGKSIKRRYAYGLWRQTLERAGISKADDLRPHDLRHEAASELMEAGASLLDIQAILGHANISTTSIYLNATMAGKREAMDKRDAARLRKQLRVVSK